MKKLEIPFFILFCTAIALPMSALAQEQDDGMVQMEPGSYQPPVGISEESLNVTHLEPQPQQQAKPAQPVVKTETPPKASQPQTTAKAEEKKPSVFDRVIHRGAVQVGGGYRYNMMYVPPQTTFRNSSGSAAITGQVSTSGTIPLSKNIGLYQRTNVSVTYNNQNVTNKVKHADALAEMAKNGAKKLSYVDNEIDQLGDSAAAEATKLTGSAAVGEIVANAAGKIPSAEEAANLKTGDFLPTLKPYLPVDKDGNEKSRSKERYKAQDLTISADVAIGLTKASGCGPYVAVTGHTHHQLGIQNATPKHIINPNMHYNGGNAGVELGRACSKLDEDGIYNSYWAFGSRTQNINSSNIADIAEIIIPHEGYFVAGQDRRKFTGNVEVGGFGSNVEPNMSGGGRVKLSGTYRFAIGRVDLGLGAKVETLVGGRSVPADLEAIGLGNRDIPTVVTGTTASGFIEGAIQ